MYVILGDEQKNERRKDWIKNTHDTKTCFSCKNIEKKNGVMDQEHNVHCGANNLDLALDNPIGKQAKPKAQITTMQCVGALS